MKGYELLPITFDNYEFLVLSTSYETPLTHLDDITNELYYVQNDKFRVIFDLLLNMGNNSERFVEAVFDRQQKNITCFSFITFDKKSKLRRISSDYFKENVIFLENSVLNSEQKKLISKGIPI